MPFEIIVYVLCVLFILPLAVRGLIFGMQLPPGSLFEKYYSAERYLGPAGNIFLIVICASALVKLALHYDFIAPGPGDTMVTVLGVATLLFVVVYAALWVRAVLKVRRAGT